jgi:hypothetical protein
MDVADEYRVQHSGESARLDVCEQPAGRTSSATNMLRQRSMTAGNSSSSTPGRPRLSMLDKSRGSFVERGMDLAGAIASKIWRQQSGAADGLADSSHAAGGSYEDSSVHSSCKVTKGGDTLLLFPSPEGGTNLGIGRSSAEAAANAAHTEEEQRWHVGSKSTADTAAGDAAATAAAAAAPDAVDAVSAAAAASFGIGAGQTHLQGLHDNLLRPAVPTSPSHRQRRSNVGVGGITFAISTAAGAAAAAHGAAEGVRPGGGFTAALQQELAGAGSGGYSLAGILKRRSSLTNKQGLKQGI